MLKISASYLPPPPAGFVSPMGWGVEAQVRERFGRAGVPADRIAAARDVFRFAAPDRGPESLVDSFERYYGPTMNAVEAARAAGRAEELHGRLVELARAHNRSADGGVSIAATFLRVTVRP